MDECSTRKLDTLTIFTENIVTYMAGFVVRKVVTIIDCEVCKAALFAKSDSDLGVEPQYCCLVQIKDRGPLVMPSESVRMLISMAEVVGKYRFWDNSPCTWLNLFNYIQMNHTCGWNSVIIRHHPCSNHTYGWDIASMMT